MNFGEKIKINFENIENGIKLSILNFPKGIAVSALDFGTDLAKRTVEGYSPNKEEEIDVISGIVEEVTTGDDIVFIYNYGDILSSMILVGSLCKKLLPNTLSAFPTEVGGIFYGEKNDAYIRIAIQKMIITKDALGSSLEINLPVETDMSKFKGEFSKIAFTLIPEIQAIQFGYGCAISKKANSNLGVTPKRAQLSFAPHLKSKIPALALVYNIVLESLAAFILVNI
ncbi:hypothetical protein [Cetobacterium sp.]|uniref:hypothetical protein n=1 Tax=Cetobacterium sp. TaxID=2071632 RepID=UPI003F387CCF